MERKTLSSLALTLLAPALATAVLSAGDRVKIAILRENVERSFLSNYLGKNHAKVRPAPGKIRAIGVRLLQGSGIALKVRTRLYVMDDSMIQAATSPGGTIFLYRGILGLKLSDPEIAALLGHEIGHIVHMHWLYRLQRGLTAQRMAQYAAKQYGKDSAQITYLYQTIKNLEYNRAEEEEADATAVRLLADAGYRPQALAELLGKVHASEAGDQAQALKQAAPLYLRSHPLMPERIAKVQSLADSSFGRRRQKRLR